MPVSHFDVVLVDHEAASGAEALTGENASEKITYSYPMVRETDMGEDMKAEVFK